MLGNSNLGIISLTCNLCYELLDKSFSISAAHLINFLILCIKKQVDFTGNLLKTGQKQFQISLILPLPGLT